MSLWNKTILKCWYYTACRTNGGLTNRACVVLFTEHKEALMSFSGSTASSLTHQCLCSNSLDRRWTSVLWSVFFSIHFELFSLKLRFYCHIYAFWCPQMTSQYFKLSLFAPPISCQVHYNIPAVCVHTRVHIFLNFQFFWCGLWFLWLFHQRLHTTYIHSSGLKTTS